MRNHETVIINLAELSDYGFIQFLRMEIFNVKGHGPTFFGRVRYARHGVEQEEGLPMDLGKGIFIATLRDDQLQEIPREELEKTLQEAAVEIMEIVRKNPSSIRHLPYYTENWFTKKHDDSAVPIFKNILRDYAYLEYDEVHSEPPDVLSCDVIDLKSSRQTADIFEIARRLKTATGIDYNVGTYGGPSRPGDDLGKVWTNFSLRKFNLGEKSSEN